MLHVQLNNAKVNQYLPQSLPVIWGATFRAEGGEGNVVYPLPSRPVSHTRQVEATEHRRHNYHHLHLVVRRRRELRQSVSRSRGDEVQGELVRLWEGQKEEDVVNNGYEMEE